MTHSNSTRTCPRIIRSGRGYSRAVSAALAAFLAGCAGGDSGTGNSAIDGTRAVLLSQEYGRLVDIFAYRRTNPNSSNRLDVTSRSMVKVESDVLVNPSIESDDLGSNPSANYRYLPFDPVTGHDGLLILWDDTHPDERAAFTLASDSARTGLISIPSAYRDQNPLRRPIPVVPRDATIRLTFDKPLGLDTSFYANNPTAVQVLQVTGDPKVVPPQNAYVPLGVRVIAKGKTLLVDPTLIGNEIGQGQANSTGLPASTDAAANVRIALPTQGLVTRQFRVAPDESQDFMGPDSAGEPSVIRDFRVANAADGQRGFLPDIIDPRIVGELTMAISAVDEVNRVITVDKLGSLVAFRGRVPFADGMKDATTGFATGRSNSASQTTILDHGDLVVQTVQAPSGEFVRIVAEVLENLDVLPSPSPSGRPAGLAVDPANGDSSTMPIARLLVSTVTALDSKGNKVTFQGQGTICKGRVHYYDQVVLRDQTQTDAGDAGRRQFFISFDPAAPALDPGNGQPNPPNRNLSPFLGVLVRFSEPLDFDSVRSVDNILIAARQGTGDSGDPRYLLETKPGNLSVVPTRATDLDGSGTVVRLFPGLGLPHALNQQEQYFLQVLNGEAGATDLAGNPLNLADVRNPILGFTLPFFLRALRPGGGAEPDNRVGWNLHRFNSEDEDGTKPGVQDWFGPFQIIDGRLKASPAVRFTRAADNQTLINIKRGDKGECPPQGNPPAPLPPQQLYQTPSMVDSAGVPILGGILEPHHPKGCRLQQTYLEDDFQLSYTGPADLEIDVEQMHWAPFGPLLFDSFDRYTLLMSHSDYRPDAFVQPGMGMPPPCDAHPGSTFGGLKSDFAGNVLRGTQQVELVKDKVFQINPTAAFIGVTGNRYLSYPRFGRTYTWRDRRLMTWDANTLRPIGTTGAHDPTNPTSGDATASVSSPWIPEFIVFPGGYEVTDIGDFRGTEKLDHNPIAAPLLLEFMVYPDDPANGLASGVNLFTIAMIGTQRDRNGAPLGIPGPNTRYSGPGVFRNQLNPAQLIALYNRRVFAAGGVSPTGQPEYIDPRNTFTSRLSWVNDQVLGLIRAGGGDHHVPWAQADFVRRVSVVTFGYFDTLAPNRHDFSGANYQNLTNWPGRTNPAGVPDYRSTTALRPVTFDVLLDPPQTRQQPGTKVVVEYSGLETTARIDTIYDNVSPAAQGGDDRAATRGNLLNANYACEAYRYKGFRTATLVDVTGITNYFEDPNRMKNASGKAPRYLNYRFSLENNLQVNPAQSPRVESFALTYRLQ